MKCFRLRCIFLFAFVSLIQCSIEIDHNEEDYKFVIPIFKVEDHQYKGVNGTTKTFTYEEIINRTTDLKSKLYKNISMFGDDAAPPKGSSVKQITNFNGGMELVTRIGVWLHADRIVKMDIEQQTLTLVVDEVFVWHDGGLMWSNEEGPPILEILLNSSEIWKPPVYAHNIVEELEVLESGMIEVDKDGLCTWKRTMMYSMPCAIAIEDFPFDKHNCYFTLTQLSTFHERMVMTIIDIPQGHERRGDSNHFTEESYNHLEWNKLETKIDAASSKGESIKFSILLERHSRFYAVVLLFPTILLNMLSLITFTLSIKNTDRETFALTLILTYFVLVMIIVETSPPTGDSLPRLGMYVIMCSFIVVITFGMSLILIELHEHKIAKKAKMPKWLSGFLERYCCFEKNLKRYCEKRIKYEANKEGETKGSLLQLDLHSNGKPQQDCSEDIASDEYKWKLFAKILNIGFFIATLLANIILPFVMFFAT